MTSTIGKADNKSFSEHTTNELTPNLNPVIDLVHLLADLNDKDSTSQLEDLCRKLEKWRGNVPELQKKIITVIREVLLARAQMNLSK
jgi:hypothetical protein